MHTPGPWETSVLADGSQWEVCLHDAGDAIAGIVDGPDAQDNALLMAAAPDLLIAAQQALYLLTSHGITHPSIDATIRPAIARATGKD